jgi:ABC-type branched-subunit amino acid transport system ATPase component
MTVGQTILKVEKLTKQFGGVTAVNEVSFDVKKGRNLCRYWTKRSR